MKIERDDTVNPYWIEDRDLLNGKRDFLSGHEDKFWKDLIFKYLAPLDKNEEKEKKNARELATLRTQSVFSMFMLNALFVLVVFMLQQEKETIFIEWPVDYDIVITYALDELVRLSNNIGNCVHVLMDQAKVDGTSLVNTRGPPLMRIYL